MLIKRAHLRYYNETKFIKSYVRFLMTMMANIMSNKRNGKLSHKLHNYSLHPANVLQTKCSLSNAVHFTETPFGKLPVL